MTEGTDLRSERPSGRVPAGGWDWTRRFRVEAIAEAEPDVEGWLAYDITLRPMDRLGRTNGRTRALIVAKVGGPPGTVDLTGLRLGVKVDWSHWDGPSPTTRATVYPSL